MKQLTFLILLVCCTACREPSPEQEVHRILSDRLMTLATAESSSGGALAARFTIIPGASVYFKGGIVAYDMELKRNLLNIDCATIGRHGVVSEEVACQMALNAREVTGADFVIATTGIAGPTGGTPETPVGTVWIAVATPEGIVSTRFFGGDTRQEVIKQSSTAAIELLLQALQKQ